MTYMFGEGDGHGAIDVPKEVNVTSPPLLDGGPLPFRFVSDCSELVLIMRAPIWVPGEALEDGNVAFASIGELSDPPIYELRNCHIDAFGYSVVGCRHYPGDQREHGLRLINVNNEDLWVKQNGDQTHVVARRPGWNLHIIGRLPLNLASALTETLQIFGDNQSH